MRLPTAETASWLEIAWSLAALVGLLFVLWMLRDARGDLRDLREKKLNGARLIAARGAVREEWLKAGILALLLLTGVSAMYRPNQAIAGPQVVYTLLAFTLPLGLTVGSILARRDRTRLLANLARAEAVRQAKGRE